MKIKSLLAGTVLAAGITLGLAEPASASSYLFAYTFAPNVYGPQQLIINGTTTLNATFTGWYNDGGRHDAPNQDYIVGNCTAGACRGTGAAYNDFFVFDLSTVSGPITSASLSIGNTSCAPNCGYGGDPTATYTNWDVTTPIATLEATNAGQTAIYTDLGSGVRYASTGVSAANNGMQVNIVLDSAAIAALNQAEGGSFAIGGSLGGITSGVPEPATWAMMLVGFAGLGAMIRSRRKQALAAA